MMVQCLQKMERGQREKIRIGRQNLDPDKKAIIAGSRGVNLAG